MIRFAYKVTNGRATDLRFVADDYTAQPGETIVSGVDRLPTLDSLSSVPLPNVIDFGAFIMRWTDAEYALLMQRRASAITAGNVTLVKQWDATLTRGQVDLSLPAVASFKANIVAAGILTQARADVIFS